MTDNQQFLIPASAIKVEVKEEPVHEILTVTHTLPRPFTSEKRFECQKCFKKVKTQKLLTSHKCNICKICVKSFCSSQALHRHIEAVHKNVQRYQCDACDFSGKNRQNFVLHFKEKHSTDEAKFECDICGSKFRCKRNLMMHFQAKHPFKVQCKICKKIIGPNALKNHMKTFHLANAETFACKYCDKRYKNINSLDYHLKSHSRIFNCTICGKIYKTERLFKDHLKLHEDPKAFSCDICMHTAANKQQLKEHKENHEKNKWKFKCWKENCKYESKFKAHLKQHLKGVHDEKRVKEPAKRKAPAILNCQCDYCGKVFKFKKQIWKHYKSHTFWKYGKCYNAMK